MPADGGFYLHFAATMLLAIIGNFIDQLIEGKLSFYVQLLPSIYAVPLVIWKSCFRGNSPAANNAVTARPRENAVGVVNERTGLLDNSQRQNDFHHDNISQLENSSNGREVPGCVSFFLVFPVIVWRPLNIIIVIIMQFSSLLVASYRNIDEPISYYYF